MRHFFGWGLPYMIFVYPTIKIYTIIGMKNKSRSVGQFEKDGKVSKKVSMKENIKDKDLECSAFYELCLSLTSKFVSGHNIYYRVSQNKLQAFYLVRSHHQLKRTKALFLKS